MDEYGNEFEENCLNVICGNYDNGFESGKTFVGKIISEISEDNFQLSEKSIDIESIRTGLQIFENYLNENENKLKIITGTRVN